MLTTTAKGGDTVEDNRIIELFFARSEQAVQTLSDQYGKLCRTIARGILADPRDVEECENDTWMQVWNAIPPERPEHLGAYVGRITRNLAINRLRRDKSKKRGGELECIHAELHECIPDAHDVEAAADDTVLQCIRRFLEQQSSRDRAMFLRRYFYLESGQEIAVSFGMSASAVSTQLGRMRAKLKLELEKEGIPL